MERNKGYVDVSFFIRVVAHILRGNVFVVEAVNSEIFVAIGCGKRVGWLMVSVCRKN